MTFERLLSLQGKVAVITGGCGQVGYATAIRLAQQGAQVISLVRRDVVEANEMMKRLPNPDLDHFALQASVTDSTALKEAVKIIQSRAGRCDILVNSAGTLKVIPPTDLHGLTDEIFDEIVTTNLRGVYATIREFSDLLKATGDGLVVNISSQASQRASNSNAAYAAAKAGVDLLTKTLAKSMAPKVRVVAISPGYMVKATSGAVKRADANDLLAASSPLKRIGWADDIASTVEACATHIRFATGTIFLIDGGRIL